MSRGSVVPVLFGSAVVVGPAVVGPAGSDSDSDSAGSGFAGFGFCSAGFGFDSVGFGSAGFGPAGFGLVHSGEIVVGGVAFLVAHLCSVAGLGSVADVVAAGGGAVWLFEAADSGCVFLACR